MEPSPPIVPPAGETVDSPGDWDVIGEERRRLQRAHSVMVCARFALNYIDYIEGEWQLDLADVIEVACDQVREAVDNLDRALLSRSKEN